MAIDRNSIEIKVKKEWCKGCGICVYFCPKKCIELDSKHKIEMARPNDCIKCGQCEQRCPDFAIFFGGKDDE